MKTLDKMIEAYNKYAMKHNYDTIGLTNGGLIGEFTPKDEHAYSGFVGFFKNLVTVYRNGYLKGDYDKIIEELNKQKNDN